MALWRPKDENMATRVARANVEQTHLSAADKIFRVVE